MNELRRSKGTTFHHNGQAVLGNAKNCLLVKDDVGRAKPFTHNLHAADHAYGRVSNYQESCGAGKLKLMAKRFIFF